MNSTGNLLEILDTGQTGLTAGMAFDKNGNLYVTDFTGQNISIFNNSGVLQGTFGSGYNSSPESILFDSAGNAYVGQADGTTQILKFDPTGKLLANYSPAIENKGTDWIDLASDQKTMYYTSEGNHIKRFDVSANTQLPDFATLSNQSACFALRIRPNTNGETMVACSGSAFRLDNTSFWTGDISTIGKVHKIDIATGKELMNITTSSDSPIQDLSGLAVFGEITATKPQVLVVTPTPNVTVTRTTTPVPEYPSLVIPIAVVMGLITLLFYRRKG